MVQPSQRVYTKNGTPHLFSIYFTSHCFTHNRTPWNTLQWLHCPKYLLPLRHTHIKSSAQGCRYVYTVESTEKRHWHGSRSFKTEQQQQQQQQQGSFKTELLGKSLGVVTHNHLLVRLHADKQVTVATKRVHCIQKNWGTLFLSIRLTLMLKFISTINSKER